MPLAVIMVWEFIFIYIYVLSVGVTKGDFPDRFSRGDPLLHFTAFR